MDEKKIVTWEMFKKYHEQLVGAINEGDGLEVDIEESKVDIESTEVDIEEE